MYFTPKGSRLFRAFRRDQSTEHCICLGRGGPEELRAHTSSLKPEWPGERGAAWLGTPHTHMGEAGGRPLLSLGVPGATRIVLWQLGLQRSGDSFRNVLKPESVGRFFSSVFREYWSGQKNKKRSTCWKDARAVRAASRALASTPLPPGHRRGSVDPAGVTEEFVGGLLVAGDVD